MTAGVAALVIQAYEKTRGGTAPTPALVKQLIVSNTDEHHSQFPAERPKVCPERCSSAISGRQRRQRDRRGSPPAP